MSSEIETRSHGTVPEFGFWGQDVSRIMLGDLPAMATPQFCKYATEAIAAAATQANADQIEQIKERIKQVLEINAEKKVISTKSPLSFPRQLHIETTPKEQIAKNITSQKFVAPASFFEGLKQARVAGDEDREMELWEEFEIALNLNNRNTANYSENPFRVEADSIVIGNMYVVDCLKFTRFAAKYINGGTHGWDSRGIPDYAWESLERLKQTLSID